ncbi:hypothetical protein KVP06_08860 [Geobacter sulfurreducens]|uniref:Cohesin domain-containing protein n=1 Tax=Geobacter sulfurreducens (strain ATCC 51573 / DSM 12127 / PCA) TaxID=243231 RepID=Q74CA4_GEOSL|nr:hypothetical protein [Geobacter sulfurreducens]AAR35147.1 hypothetical protein GSU1770 [Geobacter sulfurreducens PCA]ADI84605.1 hypothetical protein KN400_1793 [Geobacter sulfurreducens KN400]UAC02517.1 hypothetical protein KVP06_08860 [Geobacter sulfurreducens]UTG91236.1 hypothetical protein J8622_09260 [Geobacter sulfurreducens]
MKKPAILGVLTSAFFVLVVNTFAFGAGGSLSAYPSGNDVLISATGLSNVDAIDITVTYDPQALSNAQAMQLSGFRWAMFLPNAATAGTIRLAMLNTAPLSGSGPLAKISFSQGGKGATGVTIVYQIISGDTSQKGNLRVTLNSGTTQSTEPSTSQPTESPVNTGQGENLADGSGASAMDGTAQTPSAGATSGDATHRGTVVLPGMITSGAVDNDASVSAGKPPVAEQTASAEESPQSQANGANETEEQHAPLPEAERPVSEPEEKPAPVTQEGYAVLGGVAARFRDYTGAKTPKALMALFKKPVADSISQDPAICLTDGKTAVRITVNLAEGGKTAPNFALRGAALKSLKKGEGNRWLVEALPEAGAVEATLIIVTGRKIMEYPLTVAPRADVNVDGKGRVTEADFLLFLARKSVGPARPFDLNGDGKVDYLDDYIYTANYLTAADEKKTRN